MKLTRKEIEELKKTFEAPRFKYNKQESDSYLEEIGEHNSLMREAVALLHNKGLTIFQISLVLNRCERQVYRILAEIKFRMKNG